MPAHLDLLDVADEVELRVVLDHTAAGAQLFDLFVGVRERGSFFFAELGGCGYGSTVGGGVGHVSVTISI